MKYQLANRVSALKPSIIREILKNSSDPDMIAFSAGNPAPEAFPVAAVQEISARILKDNPILALQYNLTEGYTPFRNTLKNYMAEKHNSFHPEVDYYHRRTASNGLGNQGSVQRRGRCDL